jgi:hypothetical protein
MILKSKYKMKKEVGRFTKNKLIDIGEIKLINKKHNTYLE